MTSLRRSLRVAAVAAAAVLAACDDGLIRPPAPAGPALVRIAASLSLSSGGPVEAYQKADQLSVRFLSSNEVRLAEVVPFDPSEEATVVSLQVPLEDLAETVTIELELRTGSQPLFRGSGSAQLTAGRASEVEIPIAPVVSSVTCAGTPFQIAVYNAARRLTAAALFATGDTVTGVTFGWSSSATSIATVNQAGDVTGLRDGGAQITCSYQGFTSSRAVQVFAVVASVQVQPAQDTTAVGTSVTFTTTHRDSLGNLITGPRPIAWASSNLGIAIVSPSGVATGVAPGSATITATSGSASGSATLLVVFPPPLVTTVTATGVGGTSATVNGAVNPQGAPTGAWFEWGTAADLTGAASTTQQQLAPGSAFQSVSQLLSNLLANQTYYFRAVASSSGGTVRGNILSFATQAPPIVRTISGTPVLSGASLQGGVNPQGLAAQAWFEWSTSPLLANSQQTAPQQLAAGNRTELPTSASLSNLTPGVTYYFRAAASNSIGTAYGQIMSIRANGPPLVTTLSPTGVTDADAVLHGSAIPNGLATSGWFELGVGIAPTSFISSSPQSLGSGTTSVTLSTGVTNLQPATIYSFRMVASNPLGTARGSLVTFTTFGPPTVQGNNSIWNYSPPDTAWIVDFYGTATPNGSDTQTWFEIASDTAFSSMVAISNRASVGSGFSPVSFTRSALVPDCGPYYYRAVATNSYGTTYGATRSAECEGGGN